VDLWFTEKNEDKIGFSVRTENILFRGKSQFQTVDVIETTAFGNMLLLDGLVMTTDQDEFVYHEMIAHVPVCHHPAPKRVVVIGGGDGGTVRELLKHSCIEEVVLCEIDEMVITASKKFFPNIAGKLDDPRVKVFVGDGVEYMRQHAPATLDIVIVDSTDPIGPGEGLFSRDFYRSVAKSLKPDGVMVAQSESPWYDKSIMGRIQENVSAGFKNLRFYTGSIPTYPRGFWSWVIAAQKDIVPANFNRERLAAVKGLKYINDEMIVAAFALPNFFKEKVER
jgi:spermidine synthase